MKIFCQCFITIILIAFCCINNILNAILQTSKTLKELHMMKFDMRDAGVTRLRENLMDNFTLTYLNLSW